MKFEKIKNTSTRSKTTECDERCENVALERHQRRTADANCARSELLRMKLAFTERDVLVVELSGKHTLSSMCLNLLRAELSIHFAYPLMLSPGSQPTIALAVDDLTLAGQILRRKEFKLLGEADLTHAA